jgi:hypothetical protein
MSANPSWVATLDAPDLSVLAPLRLVSGLDVALLPPVLWLRGPDWNEPLALALRKIPGLRRWTVLDGDRLLPEGARVPTGRLPALVWRPLRESLALVLPPAVRAGADASPAALSLVRSTAEQPANALLTGSPAWRDFATTAAEIRLRSLRFAAAHDGRVWIEGTPVPALPGQRYYLQAGVAVPCGWSWSPPVEIAVLRRWLGLADGDTALADVRGQWEIVKAEQFVPASRQAARLTAEVLSHE